MPGTGRQPGASANDVRNLVDTILARIRSATVVLGLGILLLQASLLAVIVILWTGTARLNEGNQRRAEVTRAQNACFNILQANYIVKVGALAETGNRQQLGEPPNLNDTRLAIAELVIAEGLLRRLDELCYTQTPDETPLDGDPNK